MKEEINKGCEFQSDCIEYKDISYLKIMPICAIHELSIACHDKVNKCKYYKLYKQLKRFQETLKHTENGRKAKANKLKRIEEIVTHCIQGGFTDEFIQEIFDICREYEEV